MKTIVRLLVILLITCGFDAFSQTKLGNLEISQSFARPTRPGQMAGGGYLTITNQGDTADTLIGATYTKGSSIEIHEMKMDGDRMMMREIGKLTIPPKGKVELAPGGYHLMLMGLKDQLNEGDVLEITLAFEKAGKVKVLFPVKATAGMPM